MMPTMAAKRAKFVTIEGIEGSGKSTLIQNLKRQFQEKGLQVFTTREPGGTELGNQLRKVLLQYRKDSLNVLSELFLMEAARAQHVVCVLYAALEKNDLVICDRFTDSTIAYQGAGRGIRREWVLQLNEIASGGLVPDLTILINLPLDPALDRANARLKRMADSGKTPEDRFEREPSDFHKSVREEYLRLAKDEPSRFFVIDGAESIDSVTKAAIKRVEELLEQSS